ASGKWAANQVFLVRPDDHLQRMLRRHAKLVESLHHLDRGHRAHVSVEVAAVWDGVNVRAKQNARQRCISSCARSKNISRLINARLQPCFGHRFHRVFAPAYVSIRICYAAHTIGERSAFRPSKDAEPFEPLSQSRGIHSQHDFLFLRRGQRWHRKSSTRGGHAIEQLTPINTHAPRSLFRICATAWIATHGFALAFAGTQARTALGSSNASNAATSMEHPAKARPPCSVPVFSVMNPTMDGPKNPPRFPTELMNAIPLAAENPVKNSLGMAQNRLSELQ